MKITNKFVMDLLKLNLETASKLGYVRKPFSWALFKTWRQIDDIEKEKED